MSTLEALNAISEAIQAHAKLPEVERSLKEAREAHDYALLELDDAKAEIERLRDVVSKLNTEAALASQTIGALHSEIAELTDRNTSLDASLSDVTRLYNDAQSTIVEKNLSIDSLRFTVDSLQCRLIDSKSYSTKLAETLKSIGASIVAAVEVPEVASEKPFPVSNPVGLHSPTNAELDGALSSEPNGNVAEPSDADLVGVAEDNSSSFNTPLAETAPGTNVYKYW